MADDEDRITKFKKEWTRLTTDLGNAKTIAELNINIVNMAGKISRFIDAVNDEFEDTKKDIVMERAERRHISPKASYGDRRD